jgi:small multidrug resistance pump
MILLTPSFFLFVGIAFFLLVVYALLWQQVLKRVPLSIAYSNKGVTLLWGLLWGFVFFRESAILSKWNTYLGIFLVLVGIFLIVSRVARKSEQVTSLLMIKAKDLILLNVLFLIYSFVAVCQKFAFNTGPSTNASLVDPVYALVFAVSVLLASFSQLLLKKSALKDYGSFWREYLNWRVILAYVLLFISLIATVFAYRGVPLSLGAVFESLGYVYILILSSIVMKERVTFQKVTGNILIVAGVLVATLF